MGVPLTLALGLYRCVYQANMKSDDLNLLADREVILLAGGPNTGKSFSVAKLVQNGQEQGFNVIVLDRDRGLAKAIKEVCGAPPDNLDYFLATTWERVDAAMDAAFTSLGPGDWFVFEMLGSLWDFAQTEYSRRVYGSLTAHQLALRADAQKLIQSQGLDLRATEKGKKDAAQAIVSKKMAYGGLEGRTDWSHIKRMHNDDLVYRAIIEGTFHVLSTTSLSSTGDEQADPKWDIFGKSSVKPDGEKTMVHKHDTVAVLTKKDNRYLWRTEQPGGLGKDRGGRPLFKNIDCTDVGMVASYLETVGV